MAESLDEILDRASICLSEQAYREAHALCMQALNLDQTNPRAFVLLGTLAADHGNDRKALDLAERAITTEPRADALTLKARCLIACNRKSEAVAAASAASAAKPTEAHTLDTLGVVFSRAGLHDRAIRYYDQAIAQHNTHGPYHYNRAAALQFLGRFDEAAAAYRRANTLNPDDYRALPAAVRLTRQKLNSVDIGLLKERFSCGEADARLHIGHALAKASEDLDDPAEAMHWLGRAKLLKSQATKSPDAVNQAIFDACRRLPTPTASNSVDDTAPVFIVGMPRTGTTLVDRILSSHSEMTAAGELGDFGLELKRMSGTPSRHLLDPETLDSANSIDLEALGQNYLSQVRSTLGISGRFTDKMPFNIFYVPIILQALPNARIVCLRRHPADTVLSNYRQLFATAFSYYTYAYDLKWTARFIVQFEQLVEHFQKNMPADRFVCVHYESLVEETESTVRRLLDFCELPYESACLSFHNNPAPVATASSSQVRQPMYRSALSRWKRYRPAMDAALQLLVREGVMDAAELDEA